MFGQGCNFILKYTRSSDLNMKVTVINHLHFANINIIIKLETHNSTTAIDSNSVWNSSYNRDL